jgi:hypothetical protein
MFFKENCLSSFIFSPKAFFLFPVKYRESLSMKISPFLIGEKLKGERRELT